MYKWPLILIGLYSLILLILSYPITLIILLENKPTVGEFYYELFNLPDTFVIWIFIAIFFISQLFLLTYKTRDKAKDRKPKGSIWITAIIFGFCLSTLITALGLAISEWTEAEIFNPLDIEYVTLICFGIIWLISLIYFFIFHRKDDLDNYLKKGLGFLLKGSIFELLICIPAHMIVRQRNECCAGLLTGIGIACGLSIMLLCFGPVVLALIYKRVQLKKPVSEKPNESA